MSGDLLTHFEAGEVLLSDGAMGTLLQQQGLKPGQAPEELNATHPEILVEVAARYAAAGSDLVHTNSFGGSPLKLAAHGLQDRVTELNRVAAETALQGAAGRALVSGSIGPCGKLLLPYGDADPAEVQSGFEIQARALVEGGVQALTIETMSDLAEAVLAVKAARTAAPSLPILATMTFQSAAGSWYTIMGNDVASAAAALIEAGADVLGGNCGQGSAGLLEIAHEYRKATNLPLMIQANAGLPELKGSEVHYPESPADMSAWVPQMVAAGVRILGGCCGTTVEHIAALRAALDARKDKS